MDISVVIPLYNEAESLPELEAWIERVMKEHNFTYEIIFVNDGSTDNSWEVIQELQQKNSCIKAIKFRRNYGKSPDCIAVSNGQKAMSSSQWMPICRTARMKYLNCTV